MPSTLPASPPKLQPAASEDRPIIVRAQNVTRILGSGDTAVEVLKCVSLTIAQGEYISIVGASGSGKSTLLYLLGGLDRPSHTDAFGNVLKPCGSVHVAGKNTTDLSDAQLAILRNRTVGFVFQFHYLLKEFTAQENVALPMFKLGELSRSAAMDRAAQLLTRLGLGEKLKRRANRLSGGEQQRVAVARALANEPRILIADEPTGNLDRRNGELIADVFHELHTGGQTIVMATHDSVLAGRAKRRITMQDGNIISDDVPH